MKQKYFILNLKTKEKISFQSGLVFGRTEGCDIQILEKLISRRHASIEKKGDQYFLKDLGSSNGTMLNCKLIKEESLIKNGDKIQIGESQFEVLFQEPSGNIEKSKPKPENSISNSRLITLRIYFFGKELFVSKSSLSSYEQRNKEWESVVFEYIQNHQGERIANEEGQMTVKWQEDTLLNRSKAVALARTVILGARLFWSECEKEISKDLAQVGVTSVLSLEEDALTVSSMIEKIKGNRYSILATSSFLKNWEDKPIGKALAIEGFSDLQELSEI